VDKTTVTPDGETPTDLAVMPTRKMPPSSYLGLTYLTPTGNRLISGRGSFPDMNRLEITLPGIPEWIVGAPHMEGFFWVITLSDGKQVAYISSNGEVREYPIQPTPSLPGIPPVLHSDGNETSIVKVEDQNQSFLTHPVYLPKTGNRAYITKNGEIILVDDSDLNLASLPVNSLPDARILVDEKDRLLVLTDPTDKYPHGVLGDSFEASSITIIETQPRLQIAGQIFLNDNEVIEGIAPIWEDINEDGTREVIVTVSDLDLGAGIVAFSEDGQRLAAGPMMGQPYRWRHQVAIAPVGPQNELELVVVRTPHIAGTVEYYRLNKAGIDLVAEFPGTTSHLIGSRNLDMAAVGDFNGDGSLELVLPKPDFTELVAVGRSTGGAEEKWRVPIGGSLNTNIAAISLSNGDFAFGVGTSQGNLVLWLP
jgi:hypothetical protein